MPLVAFTLKAEKRTHGYSEFDVADRLRQFGWVVPVRVPALHVGNAVHSYGVLHNQLLSGCTLFEKAFLVHMLVAGALEQSPVQEVLKLLRTCMFVFPAPCF